MTTFQVNDMTCGGCAAKIKKAVAALDPQATVSIDVAARRVAVQAASAGEAELQQAITRAGYTPALVSGDTASKAAPRRGGCGCG